MTTYNTGNPLGSSDPKDLYDNAQNLDTALNSSDLTWTDRLGNLRPTFQGAVSDAITATELADGTGASRIGYTPSGTGAVATTVEANMRELDGSPASNAQRYRAKVRTGVTDIPVPCFRPTQANTTIAVDICPNGAPADYFNNGKAWLDVCDVDVQTGTPAVAVARVGITSTKVQFGSKAFNGGTAKPVDFIYNDSIVASFDSSLDLDIGFNSAVNAPRELFVTNSNGGVNAYAALELRVDASAGNNGYFRKFSTTYSADSGNYTNDVQVGCSGSASRLHLDGPDGVLFNLGFPTSTTNRARLTPAGFFKATNSGIYGSVAGLPDATATANHWFQSNQNGITTALVNSSTGSNVINGSSYLATGAAGKHFAGYVNAVEVFNVQANGSLQNATNSYGAISDAKLKTLIEQRTGADYWEKFKQIKFWIYSLIADPTNQQLLGVVAQELESVFPGLVDRTPDMRVIKKTRLVPKTRQVTKPKTQKQERTEIALEGNKYVKKTFTDIVELQEPQFDEFPVFDEAGNPVLELVEPASPELPAQFDENDKKIADAQPAKEAVFKPLMHKIPRMETVDVLEEYEEFETTGEYTLSVKYSVLGLIAEVITQELQHRVEDLNARLAALEAK